MKGLKALSYALGVCVFACSISCRDDIIKPQGEADKKIPESNAVLTLSADLGEEEYETKELAEEARSFTLESGTASGRNQPHISIAENEQITAQLYFAYVSKNKQGQLTGRPTLITTPVNITFTAKTERKPGSKTSYTGLEALQQSIQIPELERNRDKIWFVMGVVGGRVEDRKHIFDPNEQLLGADNDLVAAGDKKYGVNIPYTFPWTRINFTTVTKTINKQKKQVDVASLNKLRFSPRGVFMRFKVLNTNPDNGVFVLKKVSIPVQTDYAPRAALKLTDLKLEDLTASKHVGFVADAFTEPRNYSFKFGQDFVEVLSSYNVATGEPIYKYHLVSKYAHYVGVGQVTKPIKIDPIPGKGYFWIWFADLIPNASKIKMELVGDPLGALKARHSVGDKLTARIPEGKVGYTIARDFNLTKTRQLIPLEFVARGNLARPGTSLRDMGFEVGPKAYALGNTLIGLNIAGGSFGEHEVYGFSPFREKDDYRQSNRFIPTVDDWRTVIPIFRWGRSNESAFLWENRNPWASTQDNVGYVAEENYGDVFGVYNEGNNRLFGSGDKRQISFEDERIEVSRFRFRGGGYQNERTKAYYKRQDDNTIYGTRWLRHTENTFEERRRYFSAYRLSYNPNTSTKGTLTVEAVYVGTEMINKDDEHLDMLEWVRLAGDPKWWVRKYQEGEVIVRTFPGGGFTNPGLRHEGEMARYYTDNRYYNDPNKGLATFEFSKSGHTIHIGSVNIGHNRTANNMLLRYFVTDPFLAYQEWGSRN